MEKCTKGYFEFDTRQDGLYLTVILRNRENLHWMPEKFYIT